MYDLSIAQDRMYEVVERVRERMHAVSEDVVTIGFGHFGDGNLHLLISDARENADDVWHLPVLLCNCTCMP
jgi:FAD/FMN-containing dehydrogenase